MTTDLPELIAAIESGPVTRELNDRVLLAIGGQFKRASRMWTLPNGAMYSQACVPLSNIQDATLVVPEEWHVLSIWLTDSDDWRASVMRDDWREREPGTSTVFSAVGATTKGQSNWACALTLAGLKAELAKQEFDDRCHKCGQPLGSECKERDCALLAKREAEG